MLVGVGGGCGCSSVPSLGNRTLRDNSYTAPLTEEEREEVRLLLYQGRDLDVISSAFNVDMLRQHLRTLEPGTWLNDEVWACVRLWVGSCVVLLCIDRFGSYALVFPPPNLNAQQPQPTNPTTGDQLLDVPSQRAGPGAGGGRGGAGRDAAALLVLQLLLHRQAPQGRPALLLQEREALEPQGGRPVRAGQGPLFMCCGVVLDVGMVD